MHSAQYRSAKRHASMLPLAAGVLSAAWLLLVPAANAETQMQNKAQRQSIQTQAPQGQAPSPAIPDQKLDAAAAAIGHVTTIKQSYQQQLATAPQSDKERIAGEANNALKKAVTDEGISVDEFNAILEAARHDPTVRQQLVQRIHPSDQ